MPPDSGKLGVDFNVLGNPVISRTVGGPAKGYVEQAVVAFRDTDKKRIYAYEIDIQIFESTKDNDKLPSLLGRDILNRWRLVLDHSKGRFQCTPTSWSFSMRY
jgi:hypothetical protein